MKSSVQAAALPPRTEQLLLREQHPGRPLDPTRRKKVLGETGPYCELNYRRVGASVWTKRVPDEVLQAFLHPGRCLAVGDMPGDPDCFGSAVAWARARKTLALPAEAHVNNTPPASMRETLLPEELLTGAMLAQAEPFHTVVLVDNDGTRIGPAAREALKQAKVVVVVDHHDVNPTKESLGLGPDAKLIVWKELGADAAALMVLATALRALEEREVHLTKDGWRDLLEPLLAAVYSDTRGFAADRASSATIGLLRSVIDGGELALGELFSRFDPIVPEHLQQELVNAIHEDHFEVAGESFATYALAGESMFGIWERARARRPETTWSDVLFAALDHVETSARLHQHDVVVFGVETPPGLRDSLPPELAAQLPAGQVKLSVRSVEPHSATLVAKHFGGSGKPHEAGAQVDGSLPYAVAAAQRFLRTSAKLKQTARLWARTSI